MTVRDLLSDETRWCHHAPRKEMDEDCLVTAIIKCYSSRIEVHAAIRKVWATGLIPEDMPFLSTWNDAPERTFAEVRRVIEEAGV